MSKAMLLRLKKHQARREERGLLIVNKRRTTRHGIFPGTTRRAGPLFSSTGDMALFIENVP